MDERDVVTVFLRNGGDVLLLKRSDAVGSYAGRWGAVAGHAEGGPASAAREEIREETGIDPETATDLVARGDPFDVEDDGLGIRWTVYPWLFDCETRRVEPNEETESVEWVPPTAILRRETVPDLWTSYDRVRPRVETVAADREHGSAYLSLRALEVLRDEAALAVEEGVDPVEVFDVARSLVAARGSMPVVRNRVDRAVTEAGEDASAAALESAAEAAIDRALAADDEAADVAADRVAGRRVATLSRSGTVTATLARGGPAAVLVAESRPGGEGADVAGDLASRLGDVPVTLTSDAALADRLHRWDAEVLLVGADAVLDDGRVANKVGTRGAAFAAAYERIETIVVAASDKVAADHEVDLEERPATELTDRSDVAVANPTFDVTPPDVVDAVATERGVLDADGVRHVADEHRSLSAWRT